MIRILAVGNSFSEDATYYLHEILENVGIENRVVNLYFPGCSFKQHVEHLKNNEAVYSYQENLSIKEPSEKLVSISEVVEREEFDLIISHQASHDSGVKETYEPFIEEIYHYLKEKQPHAKFFLNETWAYEIDSPHDQFYRYDHSQEKMFQQLKANYHFYSEKLGLPLIPTGEVLQTLRKEPTFDYANGGMSLCRDGYHLHFLYGRYLAALVWSKYLLGVDVSKSTFIPKTNLTEEKVDLDKVELIKKVVSDN